MLLAVILVEILLFQNLGRNFLAESNVSNIFRHSVEIGLLALVMTPVILTGGIDLSLGSMMGLCAVVFGLLVKQFDVSPWLAAVAAISLGAFGGMGNAFLITRMNLPPLIVTLGTFSLFRGLAEALTKGSEGVFESRQRKCARPSRAVVGVFLHHFACLGAGAPHGVGALTASHRFCAAGRALCRDFRRAQYGHGLCFGRSHRRIGCGDSRGTPR